MSHQSLEDLVNVTGTPADNKILKYSSGSWSPADESGGGGSSGAEYLEIYEKQSSNVNKPLDYTDWMTDAGSQGDGYRGAHLYTGGDTKVINNTLSASDVDLKSNLSSYTFNSWYPNELYFIKPSGTAKYILDVRQIIVCTSSSAGIELFHIELAQPSYSGANPTPIEAGGLGQVRGPTSTMQKTIAYYTPNSAGFWNRYGNVLDVRYTVEISAHASTPLTPATTYYFAGGSGYNVAGAGRTVLPKHSAWSAGPRLGITERFTRLTKIA